MKKETANVPASVHQRLLNVTKLRGGDFNLTLQRYAASRFRDRFALKGAMLFVLWHGFQARPTRDVDLAGYWDNDSASLREVFREICELPSPNDGLAFRADSIAMEPIRDASEYHGFRLRIPIELGQARISLQVDVGFGDAIVPQAADVVYPVLLEGEAPQVRAYPAEAVIAEKLHAMVVLGEVNSRFKDFLDVDVLARSTAFQGATLAAAIHATFARRGTTVPPSPPALTAPFYGDGDRANGWARYLKRFRVAPEVGDFRQIGERVVPFLAPPGQAISSGLAFDCSWAPGGPWR